MAAPGVSLLNSDPAPRPKIVFIMGSPRSGSTLLGNLLGELPGAFHVGELGYLWERHLALDKRKCGCGSRAQDCVVWSGILADVAPTQNDVHAAVRTQQALLRFRGLRTILARHPLRDADVAELLARMEDLYLRIAANTNSSMIIDGTKRPQDAAIVALMRIRGWDVRLLHLTRNPVEMVISRQRKKMARERDGKVVLDRATLVRDSISWCVDNTLASLVRSRFARDSSMRARFEDLVGDPELVWTNIVGTIGAQSIMPFDRERRVHLKPNHALGGNHNRFVTGEVRISLRERRQALRRSDRVAASALVLPISWAYGYRSPWR